MVRHWREQRSDGWRTPRRHQRRWRGVHAGRARDRADQQVHRGRLADRHRRARCSCCCSAGSIPLYQRIGSALAAGRAAAAAGAPQLAGGRPGGRDVAADRGRDLDRPLARRRGHRGHRQLRRARGRRARRALPGAVGGVAPGRTAAHLRSVHRSLGPPMVEYLRELERAALRPAGRAHSRGAGQPGRGSGSCRTSAASCWSRPSSAAPATWSSAGSDTGWPPWRAVSCPAASPSPDPEPHRSESQPSSRQRDQLPDT